MMFALEICFEYLPVRFCKLIANKLILLPESKEYEILLSSNRVIIKGDVFCETSVQKILYILFRDCEQSFKQNNIYFFRPLRSVSAFDISIEYLYALAKWLCLEKINETFINSLQYRKVVSTANLFHLLKRYNSMPNNIHDTCADKKIALYGEKIDIKSLNEDKLRFLENVYVFSFVVSSLWQFDTFKKLINDLFCYSCTQNGKRYVVSCVTEMHTTRPSTAKILCNLKTNVQDKLEEIDFILLSDSYEKMIENAKNILFSKSKTIYDLQQLIDTLYEEKNKYKEILWYFFLEKASKLFAFVNFAQMKGHVCERAFDISNESKQNILFLYTSEQSSKILSNDVQLQICLFIKNSIEIASCEISSDTYQSQTDILFIRRKCFQMCNIMLQNDSVAFYEIWQKISLFFDKTSNHMFHLFTAVVAKKMILELNEKYQSNLKNIKDLQSILETSKNTSNFEFIFSERKNITNKHTMMHLKRIYNFVKPISQHFTLEINESDFTKDELFLPLYKHIVSSFDSQSIIQTCSLINNVFDNNLVVAYNADSRRMLLSFFIYSIVKRGIISEENVST